MSTTQRLARFLAPFLYLAGAYVVFLAADAATGFVRRSHPDTYEWLAGSPRGVAVLFAVVALPVLAVVTTLLLRLEGTARPTVGDHLRHSVLWYMAGLLYWWGPATPGRRQRWWIR